MRNRLLTLLSELHRYETNNAVLVELLNEGQDELIAEVNLENRSMWRGLAASVVTTGVVSEGTIVLAAGFWSDSRGQVTIGDADQEEVEIPVWSEYNDNINTARNWAELNDQTMTIHLANPDPVTVNIYGHLRDTNEWRIRHTEAMLVYYDTLPSIRIKNGFPLMEVNEHIGSDLRVYRAANYAYDYRISANDAVDLLTVAQNVVPSVDTNMERFSTQTLGGKVCYPSSLSRILIPDTYLPQLRVWARARLQGQTTPPFLARDARSRLTRPIL